MESEDKFFVSIIVGFLIFCTIIVAGNCINHFVRHKTKVHKYKAIQECPECFSKGEKDNTEKTVQD